MVLPTPDNAEAGLPHPNPLLPKGEGAGKAFPDPVPLLSKERLDEVSSFSLLGGEGHSFTLLAIDPGRAKCGLAVVSGPQPSQSLERAVVETERLTLAVADILRRRPEITTILLGDGTNSATLRRALAETFPHLPLQIVNEYNTSVRARQRFLAENAAPGWRRLLPRGLRSPELPYDDYAALILAEDYFLK